MAQSEVRLGSIDEVIKIAGLSRSEIWRRASAGTFPRPVQLAPRCSRWPLHEVEAWVRDRLAERGTIQDDHPAHKRLAEGKRLKREAEVA